MTIKRTRCAYVTVCCPNGSYTKNQIKSFEYLHVDIVIPGFASRVSVCRGRAVVCSSWEIQVATPSLCNFPAYGGLGGVLHTLISLISPSVWEKVFAISTVLTQLLQIYQLKFGHSCISDVSSPRLWTIILNSNSGMTVPCV